MTAGLILFLENIGDELWSRLATKAGVARKERGTEVIAGSWIDHVTNAVEVRAKLPDGLALDDLLFLGVSVRPGNILIVETLTQSMPPGVPARWIEGGAKFLAVTFRMGLRTVDINAQEVDELAPVRLHLEADKFSLSTKDGANAAALQIRAQTFFVEVILKPMHADQLRP